LPAGTVSVGDVLEVAGAGRVRVRGLQALGRPAQSVSGVARVALNVVADDLAGVDRGGVLVSPDRWWSAALVDVRLVAGAGEVPERPLLHVGATSETVHARPLGENLLRLRLDRALPLRVGDRVLLRDPGSRRLWGADVLDPAPPPLRRRGAARARAAELRAARPGDAVDEVRRRGLVRVGELERLGIGVDPGRLQAAGVVVAGGWALSRDRAAEATERVRHAVAEHERASALAEPLSLTVLADRVGLPSADLVARVVPAGLEVGNGRVSGSRRSGLPPQVEAAVKAVLDDLAEAPFAAPPADRLRELGLDGNAVAAAARAGLLFRPAPGIVLPPDGDRLAVRWLAELPQPFTTSQARQRLGTSRRVVLPLLEHLDRAGLTRRLPDDRREVTGR
jgi:selenocysteine-specific elongation factor